MRCARWLAAVFLVALALPALAQEKNTKVVATDKENDGRITLEKGATLLVKLKYQGGTGYNWAVAKNDEKVLKPAGKPTTEAVAGEKARPGGPRLMVFTFEAVAPGESRLQLDYRRPFEKDKEPARKYTLTVTVK
jgi:inhibitor of cysteine peptidase